ncbi:MAG: N-acyl amino acid synthase FeeM domain-containing protein [Acidibrevibacterium sp.]|uniref:N-acyl amino acid synthase FeeM domain-containing protein n=1 Tax=Acidibrevibacterium sp. TaxID=2606776 RepID=UPI003D02F01F
MEIRHANTDNLRLHAYHIRYKAYLSHGHIAEKKKPFWSDKFDHTPSTTVFLLFKCGIPVATIRLCFFDPSFMDDISEVIPSVSQFNYTRQSIAKKLCLLQKDFKVVEISKLASVLKKNEHVGIFVFIYEFLRSEIFNLGADIIVISVRFQHVKFYTRFGFKVLESGKFYQKDNVVLSLLACGAKNFCSAGKSWNLNFSTFSNLQNGNLCLSLAR